MTPPGAAPRQWGGRGIYGPGGDGAPGGGGELSGVSAQRPVCGGQAPARRRGGGGVRVLAAADGMYLPPANGMTLVV